MKTMDINKTPEKEVIDAAIKILNQGGLVIFPTETVYGAGVDATNPEAVSKLLAYKSRREGKPLSIAVPDQESAAKYVEINDQAQKLYQNFLPGPVTVVSQSLGKVAPGVESEFKTLGVRIPDHQLMLKILKKFNKPLTATSANASGKKRPYTIDDIMGGLSEKQKNLIDLILDAGELPKNEPSTVIDTTLSTPTTLREGKVKTESRDSLISRSEEETKKIAGTLMLQHWDEIKDKGLVIGLDGVLGAGKTIFTKGVAEFLQIKETITSPTYSYIEEYDYERYENKGKLYHIDLWKIETPEELERLEIEKLMGPNNLIVIEWYQQGKNIEIDLELLIRENKSGTREIHFN